MLTPIFLIYLPKCAHACVCACACVHKHTHTHTHTHTQSNPLHCTAETNTALKAITPRFKKINNHNNKSIRLKSMTNLNDNWPKV